MPQGMPQQAPPQYPTPQQYAQQPQQAPPAPGYGGAHPQGVPQFRPPDAPQANIIRPRLLDFGRENRLVLVSPIKIERDLPNTLGKPGDKQDRLTADVVILDGPLFAFGGAPEKNKPHTHTTPAIPYEILSMFISSAPLISQCERRLGEMVLGRLAIRDLPNGNTAYRLLDPSPADEAIAQQYLVDKMAGRIAPPQQIEATQPVAPQAQQQYMTQPAPVPQYAGASQQAYAAGAAQGAPQYPQAPQQAYAGAQVPQPPQYGGVPQGQMPAAPQQYTPPAQQLDIDTPPVGFDPEWWRNQPPEYRQMVAAQAATRPGV
jgi:hypothetical protein